jgi:hypothetical protein
MAFTEVCSQHNGTSTCRQERISRNVDAFFVIFQVWKTLFRHDGSDDKGNDKASRKDGSPCDRNRSRKESPSGGKPGLKRPFKSDVSLQRRERNEPNNEESGQGASSSASTLEWQITPWGPIPPSFLNSFASTESSATAATVVPPSLKPCDFCLAAIPKDATRCAFCTSHLR